ncbi:hypothetical protein QQ045_005570 [Rhodiola kirilowii]
MSGSLRFESTSASSEELGYTNSGYSNGHRGNYLGSSLGRSGSFRESSENRVFGSGTVSRGHAATITGELPLLSQCLALEPFTICDHKFNRSGEVKRVLGFSFGIVTEDDPLGAVRARSPPPVAQEDLKRFKASVADTSMKARGRTKKLVESLHKLNKYCDAINSHKYQRNELLTNEKSGGPILPKSGGQMQRNLQEDKSKNVLNRRVRTAVADLRSEGRNNALPRQNLLLGKDKDALKESSPGSDIPDEKIRKLPAGGDGWDRKMKRKRSIGTVFMRSSEDDTDLKRPMPQKLNSDSNLQPCDAQSARSGSLSGTSSMKDGPFSVSMNARGIVKNEAEKVSLLRDATTGLCKERVVAKGNNNKVNIREDNHAMSSSPVMKGKSSRAPRTGPVTVPSSSPNISRGSTEGWEQPSSVNKFQSVNGTNSRKRPIISGSSSTPMAQWVGQRPQKIQRNRRANLVSPVSNHDDMQTSSEGCSLDTGGRTNSSATNGSAHMKNTTNGLKQLKVKHEIVSSPGLFSESEESGAGNDKFEEKGKTDCNLDGNLINGCQQTGSSSQPMKKNKMHFKDDNGDGVRRQGRSGRNSQALRSSASPINEKLESATKPARNARPGYDKSGSKSGRPPLKKSSDRSKFTRLGQLPNGGSPDCTGDSDDDREELLAVAEFVRDSSSVTCANSFWKQMERVFEFVRSGDEDEPYLEQELKSSEQLHNDLWQMLNCEDNILGNDLHGKDYVHQILVSEEKERNVSSDVTIFSARTADVVNEFQDTSVLKGTSKDFPPLYQRLLSALIVEDESVEFDEAYGESDGPTHLSTDNFPFSIDHRKDDMGFEYDAILGLQRKRSVPINPACNGNYLYNHGAGVRCNGNLFKEDYGSMYNPNEDTPEHLSLPVMPPIDCPYDQMHLEERLLLELHSIGLYPESVPELSEDDEALNEEILAIKKGLHELVNKKRLHLREACKAIQVEKEQERRYLEQLAMDKLTEVAFKKLLATRGSNSSKSGPAKISRQIAMAFIKRTLARCRNFEASGKSCFGDPPVREILSARPCVNGADPSHHARPGSVPNRGEFHGSIESPSDLAFGRNSPMFNRGKKKEVLLDDVGTTTLRASTALGNQLLGGAKGKRSERDARNNTAKNGRPSLGSSKGERQPKPKPKQNSSQHPTSAFPGRSVHNTGNMPSEAPTIRKKNTGPSYPNSDSAEPKKNSKGQMDFSSLPLHDLDSIEDLGVATSLGEHQDFDTWLNFDDDVLPEHDALDPLDLSGLEIPMDDLSDLNMIL